MDPVVKATLDKFEAAQKNQSSWLPHWQDLADTMHPRRADFTVAMAPGEKRASKMFDSAPMLAARGLASSIEGLLTPKTQRWFGIKLTDEALNEQDFAKAWIDEAEARLWDAIYAPKAMFIKAFAEAYLDLATFGTAVVYMGENRDMSGLVFRTLHLKNCFILVNGDGRVDTIALRERLTATQARKRFGEDNLGAKAKEALKQPGSSEKFEYVQVVEPREDRDPRSRRNSDMPFASRVIETASEHLVEDTGYHEFPYAVMRWDTASGEDYGRSPGMLALGDAQTLNQMAKTMLKAGHKAVDPPWLMPADSVVGAPRTYPGGITYFDSEVLSGTGLSRPVFPMVSGANIPLGEKMQAAVRDQVFAAFFKNILNLPVDGPQMTAYEVAQRKEEFVRVVGPVFGRLETDGPAAVVERSFGIMARHGGLPPASQELQGREIDFRYESPVERIRKQIESATLMASIDRMKPLIEFDPTMMDHFDRDRIMRDIPEATGMPQRWLRPEKIVMAERRMRAEIAQKQQQMDAGLGIAERVAKVAKDAPQMLQRPNEQAQPPEAA
jgi:hypothetical protein